MLPLIIVQYCAILSNIVKHRFHVWLPMFGITAASPNIKQDLVAVRQKKLDDKVVEVISTMIQSQTLFFFQKPATEPDSAAVHGAAVHHPLPAGLLGLPLPELAADPPHRTRLHDLDLDMGDTIQTQDPGPWRSYSSGRNNQHFFRPENRANSPVFLFQCYKYFYVNSNIFSTRIKANPPTRSISNTFSSF